MGVNYTIGAFRASPYTRLALAFLNLLLTSWLLACNVVISSSPVTAAVGQVRTGHEPGAILGRLDAPMPPQVAGCVGGQNARASPAVSLRRLQIAGRRQVACCFVGQSSCEFVSRQL